MAKVILVLAGLLVAVVGPHTESAWGQQLDSVILRAQIESIRADASLVGIGATVVVDGKVVAAAVSGRRKQGSDVEVTVDDKWHVGSITKSMTATVIAKLVERGELAWDARLPDLLPEMAGSFHADWSQVTLHHVLTHSAGLPANFSMRTQLIRPDSPDETQAARKQELSIVLAEPPSSKPGSKFAYSNVGYTLAGFIAGQKAGTTWEELIERELFIPLEMKSAGFGAPRGTGSLDQPWGHQRALFMRSPMDPAIMADNSPIIGPAGIVHLSMADLAKYGWEHLRGEQSDTALLKSGSWTRLHTSAIDDYAYGWMESKWDWADGRAIWHNGSNTMWYALLILVPSRNAVIVVVTNDGHLAKAQPAFFEFAEKIAGQLPGNLTRSVRSTK